MRMCDRCSVSGCCLNYLGKACENARKEACPDVKLTNYEKITELSPETLATFLLEVSGGMFAGKTNADVKQWLLTPVNSRRKNT